jgi:hypothetical protein
MAEQVQDAFWDSAWYSEDVHSIPYDPDQVCLSRDVCVWHL